jgi:hypothetical protein
LAIKTTTPRHLMAALSYRPGFSLGIEVDTEMDEDAQIDNVAILQTVWGGIQRRHPDVPDVVIEIQVLRFYTDGTVPTAVFTPAPCRLW